MQELNLHDMWFQQDSAICHTECVIMDLFRGEFSEHFISHSGPVNWPSRACDLTPLEYFLWCYVKAHVFTDKPALIDTLKQNTEVFICEITAEMLERVRMK